MRGLKVGNTEVKFFVHHHDGRNVYSQPLSLTVFEPLVLNPRRLVLLPGSKFDVDHAGGPKTDLIYRTSNSTVATVNNKGLVSARSVGDCIVYVEAVGLWSLTGKKVVHATDAIPVEVRRMDGVEIVSPSRKMLVGNNIRLRVRG